MRKLWWLPSFLLIVAVVVFWHPVEYWIAHETGSYDTPGTAHDYNFFSGFGSDLGEYVIIDSIFSHTAMLWKMHTCHLHWWCWRSGSFQLGSTPYKLCHHHHPDDHPTVQEAVAAYTQVKEAA